MVACLAQWRHFIVECDDAGLPDRVRDIESVSRMVYSVMLDTVAELDSRTIAATAGFCNTRQLLAGMLNLSPSEAGTRVVNAGQLAAPRTLTGEVLAPLLPDTAAALAAGEIGPGQVRVITEAMTAIPAYISTTERDAAEADLARHARSVHPTSLVQDRSADPRVSRPGRSTTPRQAPTRPRRRRTAVMGPPRRATWIGGLPRTRTPCRGPIADRTTRRTPPR
jgi:Domain of unknown function (DUF222)